MNDTVSLFLRSVSVPQSQFYVIVPDRSQGISEPTSVKWEAF